MRGDTLAAYFLGAVIPLPPTPQQAAAEQGEGSRQRFAWCGYAPASVLACGAVLEPAAWPA